jgi:hypothetical protein
MAAKSVWIGHQIRVPAFGVPCDISSYLQLLNAIVPSEI